MGFIARKWNNLAAGVIVGLVIGALVALPIAMMRDPNTGQTYFWEILIPGAIVGLIVGFATQRYGTRPAQVAR
jgi:membrane protease YdiL (CAAX protease family)